MTTFKLEQYINFESLEELNHHTSLHISNNELSTTQFNLFTLLSRYSVKYLGASYLKLDTIAGLLGVSKRTVQRGIAVLIELNMIEKINCFRKVRGGFGASIFIIKEYEEKEECPFELSTRQEAETTSGSRLMDKINQTKTSLSNLKISKYLVTPKSSKIDREHNINHRDVCPSHIPLAFGNRMLKFIDSATVNRLYYSIMNALDPYKDRADYDSERLQELAERGFNALVTAIKNHNYNPEKYSKVKNIFSYAYMSTLRIALNSELGI